MTSLWCRLFGDVSLVTSLWGGLLPSCLGPGQALRTDFLVDFGSDPLSYRLLGPFWFRPVRWKRFVFFLVPESPAVLERTAALAPRSWPGFSHRLFRRFWFRPLFVRAFSSILVTPFSYRLFGRFLFRPFSPEGYTASNKPGPPGKNTCLHQHAAAYISMLLPISAKTTTMNLQNNN